MCGCEKHHDEAKPCTCICPEHGNFQVAHDLALSRYDEIVRLHNAMQEAEAEAWAEGYLRGTLDTTSDLEPADNPYRPTDDGTPHAPGGAT